jgi:hypothetical protein
MSKHEHNVYLDLNSKTLLTVLLITIVGFLLRFYGYSSQGYWMDEDFTFFLAKPNQSYSEIVKNLNYEHKIIGNPNAPAIFYFILNKFFFFFGYSPDNGRILTTIFNSLSIPVCYFISLIWTKNKLISLYFTIFVALNLYLIWEAQETRPQSMVLFFSMLSIFFFSINFIYKENLFYLLLTLIINLLLLSSHPVSFAIVFAQNFFLIYKIYFSKIFKKKLLIVTSLSIVIYFIANFNYLFDQVTMPYEHFSKLSPSFFYSYHFKTFFGSIYLGTVLLIMIIWLFIINIKHNINDNLLVLLSFIIFFSYASTVLISIFKTGLMHPRYKIYCVPLILLWISINISYLKNYKIYFYVLIFLIASNTIFFIEDRHLKKPPTQKILKIISESDQKNLYTINIPWKERYDNTLIHYNLFRDNKLKLINNTKDLHGQNSFWLICGNKIRSTMIFNENTPDFICDLNLANFIESKTIKLEDYILVYFIKNNKKKIIRIIS